MILLPVFRLGFKCPINYNPAEYYVKLLSTTELQLDQNDEELMHLCQKENIPIPDKYL